MHLVTLNQLVNEINNIDSAEIVIGAISILLSLLLGSFLCRLLKNKTEKKTCADFLQSLSILVTPFLVIIFIILGAFIYKSIYDDKPLLLAYLDKLAFGWFIAALAMLFFSKKTVMWFICLIVAPITILNIFNLWGSFVEYMDSYSFTLGQVTISLYQIIKTVLVILILIRLAKVLTQFSEKKIHGTASIRSSNKVLVVKLFQIILYFLIFLVGLDSLGISITTLAVFSGAIGVGLGFCLQKITSNFISGIILLLEKSLEIGDLIELSDGTTGFVRRSGARYILIETSQGKEVLVPNEDFITQRVTNWTYSNHKGRIEIPLSISYDSDIELAKKIILETAASHPRCSQKPIPVCYIREFANSSINLLLQFWVDDIVEGTYGPQSDIMLSIWQKFKESNIKIPCSQHEVIIKK